MLAFFSLLLPLTGRGTDTAIIALTIYTLQIIYRNIILGLNNVPEEAKDAGRGMGMTSRQLLWKMLGADHPMEAHKLDSRCIQYMGASADVREGVQSFLEKRPPRFSMRPSRDLPPFHPLVPERKFS